MEVSAIRYSGGIGVHARSPLLRVQSDERLIALARRGNQNAFEVLVARYQSRLLAFCRHLLGSREDAEDVLQEVFAAAFNAIQGDDRAINVRPWLYRIARNRSLNHLRRARAVGQDSMDVHLSEHGASTADKVHEREQFRLLVGDIQQLPETQRTALILREMDALSYEQIAEAMEQTVSGVKSLLVRARISLAEAAEARQLSCEEVRIELAEVAEGLRRRPSPLVRRHLKGCSRCVTFHTQLKQTNKALAALLPVGPLAAVKRFLLAHLWGGSAGGGSAAGSGAAGAGAAGAGTGGITSVGAGTAGVGAGTGASAAGAVATAAGAGAAVAASGGALSGALATKAAAGLAVALVGVGAVEASHLHHASARHRKVATATASPSAASLRPRGVKAAVPTHLRKAHRRHGEVVKRISKDESGPARTARATHTTTAAKAETAPATTAATTRPAVGTHPTQPAGRTDTQTDPTILPPLPATTTTTAAPDTGTTPATTATPSPNTNTTPPSDTTDTTSSSDTTTAPSADTNVAAASHTTTAPSSDTTTADTTTAAASAG
jgi:RNA polymerase sigma factor (sigma-70 family)